VPQERCSETLTLVRRITAVRAKRMEGIPSRSFRDIRFGGDDRRTDAVAEAQNATTSRDWTFDDDPGTKGAACLVGEGVTQKPLVQQLCLALKVLGPDGKCPSAPRGEVAGRLTAGGGPIPRQGPQ
jgi:hypothetical protein